MVLPAGYVVCATVLYTWSPLLVVRIGSGHCNTHRAAGLGIGRWLGPGSYGYPRSPAERAPSHPPFVTRSSLLTAQREV